MVIYNVQEHCHILMVDRKYDKKDVLIAKNNLLRWFCLLLNAFVIPTNLMNVQQSQVEHKSTVIIGVAHSCDVK